MIPTTIGHAIGRDGGHPIGIAGAWLSALVVVAVALGGQRLPRFRPYSLLASLVLGTLVYFAAVGLPDSSVSSGWGTPGVFPWGAPEFSFSVVIPFLIAGALAACNTIASINAMAVSLDRPGRRPGPSGGRSSPTAAPRR